jgi:DNA topoisomerase-1
MVIPAPQEQQGIRKARKAGLHYIHDLNNGWTRRRCGRGFTYHSVGGKRLTGKRTLKRIEALVIPPAWEDVRICPSSSGHIQAIGRDAKGRQQYLYHVTWTTISAATKFDRLASIGKVLPKVRRRVRRDLASRELSRERVVAAVVRLIDKAHIRVGSPAYVEGNGSHGATTLTAEQVEIDRFSISLDFPGKSGRQTEVSITDKKVASVIQKCEEIDGQFLFCYRDHADSYRSVSSSDVNGYLQEVANEGLTAKDFRTWWGSVIALKYLRAEFEESSEASANRTITKAIRETAEEMGHTASVCRQSYIHPGLLAAVEAGTLSALLDKYDRAGRAIQAELTRDEDRFLAILPAITDLS